MKSLPYRENAMDEGIFVHPWQVLKNPPKNWEGFIIEQKVELKLILV